MVFSVLLIDGTYHVRRTPCHRQLIDQAGTYIYAGLRRYLKLHNSTMGEFNVTCAVKNSREVASSNVTSVAQHIKPSVLRR